MQNFNEIQVDFPDEVIEACLDYVRNSYSNYFNISKGEDSIHFGNTESIPEHLSHFFNEPNIMSLDNYILFCVNLTVYDSLDFFFSLDELVTIDTKDD